MLGINASFLQKILKKHIRQGRVNLHHQDGQKLVLKKKDYEAAFLCWLLEHVPEPIELLKGVRKHLKKGAPVYCTEVFNQTLFLQPYSPAFLKYWFEFNDLQYTLKGHPFIGASLGNLLSEAGFRDIRTELVPFHFDSRTPEKREAFIEYFFNILLSAEKSLLTSGRVDKKIIQEMKREVELVKKDKDAVFFYSAIRATGLA